MNGEEIEKLAEGVIMKMTLEKEVREMDETRACTVARVGFESPQGQGIPKGLCCIRNTEGDF